MRQGATVRAEFSHLESYAEGDGTVHLLLFGQSIVRDLGPGNFPWGSFREEVEEVAPFRGQPAGVGVLVVVLFRAVAEGALRLGCLFRRFLALGGWGRGVGLGQEDGGELDTQSLA